MKKHLFISKFFVFTILFALITNSITAQQSMSLGDLKFVMPSADIKASSRTLSMRMVTTGIPSKIYAKVGGIAFIQTATPEFNINTLKLGVNIDDNTTYAIINDTTYNIPLEVWELQSIINYATQEDNAAVTLYGDNDARIKYHSAFLDNLMGLRLLQTDLLLTNFLNIHDKGKLPTFDNGEYILSKKEILKYQAFNSLDSLLYNMSYENIASLIFYKFYCDLDSIGESYDTYIYTDYDQPIKFNVSSNKIIFNGNPYYRFASRDTSLVDTLEMYYEIKNFIDLYETQKSKYKNLSISNIFKNNNNNKVIYDLKKITQKNTNISQKAESAFKATNYYTLCNTYNLNQEDVTMNYFISKILQSYVKIYSDSIINSENKNFELQKLCNEFLSINDSLGYYDYPIVSSYAKLMFAHTPTDSTALKMYNLSQKYNLTYDKLLIEYMYNHKTPLAKVAENSTNYFRQNDNTYLINPIVFDAAINVCHWSAFFRYVKENFSDEWNSFIENTKLLKYDAPIVQTPIDFVNDW